MTEYSKIVDFYSNYWWQHFSNQTPEKLWGDKVAANAFLEKYWLNLNEYDQRWRAVQNAIFINQDSGLPAMLFAADFELIILKGGCLFVKEDFIKLQNAIMPSGDKYIFIIENSFGRKNEEPIFRMKFPANISWEELTSGNYISSVLIEMARKEYFVFGDTGNWGRYAANDYFPPLDILGMKNQFSSEFHTQFKQTPEEIKEMYMKWLPDSYK